MDVRKREREKERGRERKKEKRFLVNLLWKVNSNKMFILTGTWRGNNHVYLIVYAQWQQLLLSLWENSFYRTCQFVTGFIRLQGSNCFKRLRHSFSSNESQFLYLVNRFNRCLKWLSTFYIQIQFRKLGTSFLRVLRFEKNRRERIRGYRDIFNVELIFQFTTRNRNKIRHKS